MALPSDVSVALYKMHFSRHFPFGKFCTCNIFDMVLTLLGPGLFFLSMSGEGGGGGGGAIRPDILAANNF